MKRRDLVRAVIALPAGFTALHALPAGARSENGQPQEARHLVNKDNNAVAHIFAQQPATPDGALLSLCRRFMVVERRYARLCDLEDAAEEAGFLSRKRRLAKTVAHCVSYSHDLLAEITDTKALTPGGVVAKAEVCMTRIGRWAAGEVMEGDRPLWSLCRDLLGYDPGEASA